MTKLSDWLDALKINQIDLNLMETAFTHGSYRGLGNVVEDYQRLEFLGDAVINLVVSDKIYKIEGLGKPMQIEQDVNAITPIVDVINTPPAYIANSPINIPRPPMFRPTPNPPQFIDEAVSPNLVKPPQLDQ